MKSKAPDTKTRYEVITQEDPDSGDLLVPIPQQLLDELGWEEGDEVEFEIDEKGTVYVKKANK